MSTTTPPEGYCGIYNHKIWFNKKLHHFWCYRYYKLREFFRTFNFSEFCPHCGYYCTGKSAFCTKGKINKKGIEGVDYNKPENN